MSALPRSPQVVTSSLTQADVKFNFRTIDPEARRDRRTEDMVDVESEADAWRSELRFRAFNMVALGAEDGRRAEEGCDARGEGKCFNVGGQEIRAADLEAL